MWELDYRKKNLLRRFSNKCKRNFCQKDIDSGSRQKNWNMRKRSIKHTTCLFKTIQNMARCPGRALLRFSNALYSRVPLCSECLSNRMRERRICSSSWLMRSSQLMFGSSFRKINSNSWSNSAKKVTNVEASVKTHLTQFTVEVTKKGQAPEEAYPKRRAR